MNRRRLRVGAGFDLDLPSACGLAGVVQGHHRSIAQGNDAQLFVEPVTQAKTLAPTGQDIDVEALERRIEHLDVGTIGGTD
jgi:hypothetical protein